MVCIILYKMFIFSSLIAVFSDGIQCTHYILSVMLCNMLLLRWSALLRYSPMKLSIAFVVDELAFRDSAECVEFMNLRGVLLMPDGSHIDCKQSLAAVLAQ